MGSSAKKKKEKKKDFQKQKLKVGKARPKADNHTDTSFRAKAIVLNQQLDVNAPTQTSVFLHQVSLLTSRTDIQRRDALAYLTTYVALNPPGRALPINMNSLLNSLCPLILDGSSGVRTQLLKLFQTLPVDEVRDNVTRILPFMRAGMTHLSRDIRVSAIDFLSYLIDVAGSELVSCSGGWYQTLQCFTTVLGWRSPNADKWSSSKASFSGDVKSTARIMQVLSDFLQTGLAVDNAATSGPAPMAVNFPLWHPDFLAIPHKSNAYAPLNLFGVQQDDEKQVLDDQEDRFRVYRTHFQPLVLAGVDAAKKEGGELGRASGLLVKTLERTNGR
ncbi:rRNA processing protein [Exophiala xenobiotica]|uniref:Pre-rRNA-processing protein n=1 Tax=Vermiconidia calcicola TaxID=1690605 RepID=A0AAV9QJQ7_9PEZI|nr:rRNA processing protein [Exophiala xenobiotica]KAK5543960.1 rRNA processing protein [Vermiconidia calcicola]KAK5549729.1 rRNA processing protein [Chaetothyriales sp. CCFEE 6169]KAK5204954.1 rRNA processing protein [Exophiala xenobiotica]KAK5229607.1 rRNA processing protein [Exophiala xenobiotica]